MSPSSAPPASSKMRQARGLGSRDEKKTDQFVEGEQLFAAPFFSDLREVFPVAIVLLTARKNGRHMCDTRLHWVSPKFLSFSGILKDALESNSIHTSLSSWELGWWGGLPTCLTTASSTSSVSLGQGHAHT